jgi:hypothetical protein
MSNVCLYDNIFSNCFNICCTHSVSQIDIFPKWPNTTICKANALLFGQFPPPPFSKIEKATQNGQKVRLIDFFPFFAPFLKIEKGAKNGRKVKALALRFSQFLPVFRKSKEEAKNERKVKALALLF